jgi:predicted ATPase
MLKRLYVHNYKCLVNFEINFDKDISLFLGANGLGKSTVFEVLTKLRRVIDYETKLDRVSREFANEGVENIFDHNDRPRWLKDEIADTRFELDIEIQESVYRYSLTIDLGSIERYQKMSPMIKEESLSRDEDILVKSNTEKTLYFGKDNGEAEFPFDKSTSSIKKYCEFEAEEFLQYFQNLLLIRINPYVMSSRFIDQNSEIKEDSSNFVEWLSHLNEENRKGVMEFENAIRQVIPEYDHFRIMSVSNFKVLSIDFKNSNTKKPISYDFEELSEGQKALFALYALLYCTPENSLICIDEPENFLALPEIQPWFNTLFDQCAERGLQALLISHHPKIINLLANDSGYWFSKENNLTRIQKISPEDESGLSIAELIDRGWIYEQ